MLHHVIVHVACEGRLHFALLGNAEGMRILDIGTGTGMWAIEMGWCKQNGRRLRSTVRLILSR